MTQEEAIARLSRYQSDEPSEWRVEEERIRYAKSKGWLQYSRKIAIKVAMSMKRQGLSRQDVADRMGCSPQYISKLLKGEENLSLETICKLEDALNIAILQYNTNLHKLLLAHSFYQLPVLRVEFQQLFLLGQLEVFETEGRTNGATHEAKSALRGDVGGEPLLRLDEHLHLVLFGKLMDGQVSVRIDYIDVEGFARVEIPDFHHVVQTVERRHIIGG